MRRVATLYMVRLCLPMLLVLVLALYFFYVNEAYQQLDLSFNSLLVIALIAIEVKDFMPDHVISVTWIDWFVTINILLIVFATALSLAIIVLEESGNPIVRACAPPLDRAVKRTQPIGALIINLVMMCYGFLDGIGANETSIGDVLTFIWTGFFCDILACLLMFWYDASITVKKTRKELAEEAAQEEKEPVAVEALSLDVASAASPSGIPAISTRVAPSAEAPGAAPVQQDEPTLTGGADGEGGAPERVRRKRRSGRGGEGALDDQEGGGSRPVIPNVIAPVIPNAIASGVAALTSRGTPKLTKADSARKLTKADAPKARTDHVYIAPMASDRTKARELYTDFDL